MIIYKLEWTSQKENTSFSALGDRANGTYAKFSMIEFFLTKEKAKAKEIKLIEAANDLGFMGLCSFIAEIEVVE